ncbi:MAG: hypothetical protein SFU99_06470 [Saprospiraceae bacterium]|nr:hypothetical protein [Saprospiraceae bacterium]
MVIETLVTTFLGYLVGNIKKSKGAEQAGDELSTALWKWIRPIFLKDEEPLKALQANPDDTANQKEVAVKIEQHLNKNPEALSQFEVLVKQLEASGEKPVGNVYNFGTVEKQVNNPTIQGDLNM